jgi:hypothetical protein
MENYFETVLEGYRSETGMENLMLEKLPLKVERQQPDQRKSQRL